MGAMLHPVGPEPARTYWIRRALILAVALILVIIVIVAVVSVSSSPAATDPPGGGSTSLPPPASAAPSDSTAPATLDAATPQGTPSAGDTATPTVWSSSAGTPSALAATPAETSATPCDPAVLRATLTGKQELKLTEANTFAISLINGGADSCIVTVEPGTFELKIYSGTDRIWSSADCAKLVRQTTRTLQSQQTLEWTMTWNGRRSRVECAERPEIPRPGTYFATAQYAGAQPVQLRMVLH